MELNYNESIYKILLHLRKRSGNTVQEAVERFDGSEYRGVCCKTVSFSNIRNSTHKVSSTWLPKQELNKSDIYMECKLDREKSTRLQLYTENIIPLLNMQESGCKSIHIIFLRVIEVWNKNKKYVHLKREGIMFHLVCMPKTFYYSIVIKRLSYYHLICHNAHHDMITLRMY